MNHIKAVALRLMSLHAKDQHWFLKRLPQDVARQVRSHMEQIEAALGNSGDQVKEELSGLSETVIQEAIDQAGESYHTRNELNGVTSRAFASHVKDILPVRLTEYLYAKENWSWLKTRKTVQANRLSVKPRAHRELIKQLAAYYESGDWQQTSRENRYG